MTLREHARGSVFERKRPSKIFITQWCPTCRHRSVRRTRRSVSFLPDHWYSLCIFFFHLSVYFSLSGDVRASVCSFPAVTVQVCTDGSQEGHVVYCFRPCGVPAVMDGLGWVFFLLRPLCFSHITSAVCEVFCSRVKPYSDQFRPETGVFPRWVFHNISVKINLRHRPPKLCCRFVRRESLKSILYLSQILISSRIITLYSKWANIWHSPIDAISVWFVRLFVSTVLVKTTLHNFHETWWSSAKEEFFWNLKRKEIMWQIRTLALVEM